MEKNIQTKENENEKEKEKERMKRLVSFNSVLKEMNIDTENKTPEELDAVMKKMEEGGLNVSRKNIEESWDNKCTLDTFNDWINVSAYKIACLDLIIQKYRWRIQNYILLGLILSTASGTISVTQFGSYDPQINFVLNLVFTIMSFAVAILTGAVKTFKIQENLEEYISLKQSWIAFSARISSEIYLPKRLRSDAEFLIKDSKTKFLDLLKIDVPVPKHMLVLAAKNVDKGDALGSQYYQYLENKHKLERGLNGGCMPCLSFMFDCCGCMYSQENSRKIIANRELAKKIKFSKIDNAKKYKQKAYQYTLSSIMLNGVKTEVNNFKNLNDDNQNIQNNQKTTECQTELSGEYPPKIKKSMFNFLFGGDINNQNAPNPYANQDDEQYRVLQKQIQDLQNQVREQQEKTSQLYITPSSQSTTTLTFQQSEPKQDSISSLESLESYSDTVASASIVKNEVEDFHFHNDEIPDETSDEQDIWAYRYC
jgi:hypothetical protein